MKKEKVIFDIESFSNFFCVVFTELNGDREVTYEISKRKNERDRMLHMMRYYETIGHNSHGYDEILCCCRDCLYDEAKLDLP